MVRNNREILSGGKRYKQNVGKRHGAEEITFDRDSRLEYLTGFHKRKVERQKKAKESIKEQERVIRIEERKKIRDERKKEMEEHLEKLKQSMREVGTLESDGEAESSVSLEHKKKRKRGGGIDEGAEEKDGEEDSWNGFSDSDSEGSVKPILKKQKVYEDDTTVEIEPLEPNNNFEYLARLNNVKLENSKKVLDESIDRAKKYAKFLGMEDKPAKKKKFRYLTKAERRANQRKANSNKRRK